MAARPFGPSRNIGTLGIAVNYVEELRETTLRIKGDFALGTKLHGWKSLFKFLEYHPETSASHSARIQFFFSFSFCSSESILCLLRIIQ